MNLLLLLALSAHAAIPAPDRAGPPAGSFAWTRFQGMYDFAGCTSAPKPLWSDAPPESFVRIWPSSYPKESLELMRASYKNPIALGWTMEDVGQGPQDRVENDTGRVFGRHESYATADGVYGLLAWDNPGNVGWTTLQLSMDAHGNVSYVMRRRRRAR
jgi:hypothetical protein